MVLCDELEARQQKQQQGRVRLNNATLDALLTTREPDEFADHWQRISTHFDLLYDHPETIAKLRAAILQLAVQGKLVPQDTNDEPASVLLERIKTEKERLVTRVKARNSKLSSPIKESEHPFLLPAGWSWLRLEDFGLFLGGGTPSKQNPAFWSGKIPWVSPKDMKVQYISDSIDHVTEEAIDNSSAKLIPEGALLMVVRGMILLHSFPVARTMREVTVNQDMKALICALPDVTEYLLRFLIAGKDKVLEQVERSSHGTCRLESDNLFGFVVALPPKEEQKRIVAKVDQLMTLCDELEAKLKQAQQHSEKLMEATVRQLLVS
jgi:type I restriction enzyme S subunit